MAFSLPSDLPTNLVDDVSEVDAAFFNNLSAMGNATKAAIATIGYGFKSATVATEEGTNSTTYTDLATTTDQITVPVGSSGKVLLLVRAQTKTNQASGYYGYMSYELSGANTVAATDTDAIMRMGSNYVTVGFVTLLTGLTAGHTTIKLKYRAQSGATASFSNRLIAAVPLPSTDGTHASGAFNLNLSTGLGLSMGGFPRPVRYTATGAGLASTAARSNMTWSHTAEEGDTVLVWVETNSGEYVTTATYAGTTMQNIGTAKTPDNVYALTLLAAFNVSAGASTVSITKNSSTHSMQGNSVSYANVTSIKGIASASGVGMTAGIDVAPVTTAGEMAVACMVTYYGDPYPSTSGGTNRWNAAGAAAQAISDSLGPAMTLSATQPGDTRNWVAMRAILNPVSTPAGAFSLTLTPTIAMSGNPYMYLATGTRTYSATTSASISDTIPAGTACSLIWVNHQGGATQTMTATIGATNAVLVGTAAVTSNSNTKLTCFAVLDPPTGTQTITVNDSSGTAIHFNTVHYRNVRWVGVAATSEVQTGQPSMSASTATGKTYANCLTFYNTGNNTFSAYNQNQRWYQAGVSGVTPMPVLAGDAYGTGSSVTFSATRSNTTYGWGGMVVTLDPVKPNFTVSFGLSLSPTLTMVPL